MDTIYIPSRGRFSTISTHKHFQRHGMENWFYVVEPFDYANYVRALNDEGISDPESHILMFDVDTYKTPYHEYRSPKGFNYEDSDGWKDGLTTGPGPARNALIDFARERGEGHCWMLDDDIQGFSVNAFHTQKSVFARGEVRLNVVEAFELYERLLDKYQNVGAAEMDKMGINMNHTMNFHFAVGTKTYTCIRINTEIDIPWRARWNDDVIYSLDYLWAGYVNLSSKIISYLTPETQKQAGGMTEAFAAQGEIEQDDENERNASEDEKRKRGTYAKALVPVNLYPSVAEVVYRYSRDHHHIHYGRIEKELVLKDGANLDDLVLGLG